MRYKINNTKGSNMCQFSSFDEVIQTCLRWLNLMDIYAYSMDVDAHEQSIKVTAEAELQDHKVIYEAKLSEPRFEVSFDVCECVSGEFLDLDDHSSYEVEGDTLEEVARELSESLCFDESELVDYLVEHENTYTPSSWFALAVSSETVYFVRLGYIQDNAR